MFRFINTVRSTCFLLTIFVAFATAAFAIDGDLDAGFAGSGKTTTALAFGFDIGSGVAVQPDGKILVAGTTWDANFETVFGVARYNVDGTLDATFGTGGRVVVPNFFFNGLKVDIALQTDGKIVLAGGAGPSGGTSDFAVIRLNPDGSPDGSFGTSGKATCDFYGLTDTANAVSIQPDGKIVAAGSATNMSGNLDLAVVRFDAAGNPDPGFGSAGKMNVDIFGSIDQANGVVVQADGKIVVAGTAWALGSSDSDYLILRLNSDGTVDVAFGTAGLALVSFADHDEGNAVALQSDGKIVVGGSAGTDSILTSNFGLVRFDTNGVPDPTFGTGGKVTTDFFSALDRANDIVIQPDGKIVAVGEVNPDAIDIELHVDFGLARYDTAGALDATFGSGGKVITDFGNIDSAASVAFTPDCRIVAAGYTWPVQTGDIDFAIARYNSSGCPVEPPGPGSTCPRTHGYWKTHPESWPVDSLVLGNQTYSKAELLSLLGLTSQTDASVTLARQLIAAKLNIASGSDPTPVVSAIADSDAVLSGYSGKLPYKVKSSNTNGQVMVANAIILTNYNQGLLTPICTP
jgi:uncharacterized delta-60 repeat protein